MKNRYDSILRKNNQAILDLVPYNPFLFTVAALEIKKLAKSESRVLELGSGEGDSALPILKRTGVHIDLLDVSKEMIKISKKNLKAFANRTKYICEDAHSYLKEAESYDIIYSAWTVHNFVQKDKKELLKTIYGGLHKGGAFILMDKVYPARGGQELLERQNARYKQYLPAAVSRAITGHEVEDANDTYRLDEKVLFKLLKEIGFKSATLVDRIERDVVIIARK